ncbi:hypothetical protein ANSO36C_51740 [Nostoc cf. commune SO-36]|uniref:Uncharacterized protein n=1 Tax=Nostoc cf. commune SO-36 TaxID=449208 RepID=A0ABM7Z848_NOSCO|nr:hypothetical protein ANSO36C_51740 [Nostoc cf. commune SO-36]
MKFVGRTGVLRVNHRTTREINEAAISYLANSILDDEEMGNRELGIGEISRSPN